MAQPRVFGGIADVEPSNNTPAGATRLSLDPFRATSGVCTLASGDNDYFVLENVVVGQAYAVSIAPIEDLPTSFLTPDTKIEVSNPANAVIASDDDSGTDFPAASPHGSVARFYATTAGDYRIRVFGFSPASTGKYLISVSEIQVLTFAATDHWADDLEDVVFPNVDVLDLQATPNQIGFTVFGTTTDVDYLAIDLVQGDILMASVVSTGALSSDSPNFAACDPTLSVIATDAATTLVTNANDGAGQSIGGNSSGIGATVRLLAPATGRYYLKLQNNSGGSLAAISTTLLRRAPTAPAFCTGDADGSGVVNFDDLTTVLANFGATCP